MDHKRARDTCALAAIVWQALQAAAHDRLCNRAGQYRDLDYKLRQLAGATTKLRKACRLGYYGAAARLNSRLNRLADDLSRDLNVFGLQPQVHPRLPTVAELGGELRQIEEEFGDWQYQSQSHLLTVKTGPVELEDVYLGPFSIELELSGLSRFAGTQAGRGPQPFRVVALEPQPASGNAHVTHPHISDDRLCTGESTFLVGAALMEGRLADFFLMVRGLIQTYNPTSPYIPLDSWSGTTCEECGERVHEDDRYYCENCGHDVCDGCSGRCSHCDETACWSCLIKCSHCEEHSCRHCMKKCSECGESCCVDCVEDELCPACFVAKENTGEQAETTDQEEQQTTPREGSVEVGQAAVPAS